MEEVIIVDYGVGNIASVRNMLKFVGASGKHTADPAEILAAKKLILPGIGNFKAGMQALDERELEAPLKQAVANGAYLLGICLGFQLLFKESEESPGQKGLGLIDGTVKKFQVEKYGLRVPHVGWNVIIPKPGARLFDTGQKELRYYFVHSYYAECDKPDVIAATCDYGFDFACAIEDNRVFGVQFHPEKSHRFGVGTFTRFVNL